MPTSGTYLWSPDLAEMVDEAFERCKVDPSTLDVSHLISARRSMNLMFVEWAAEDNQDFRIDRLDGPGTGTNLPFPLVQGQQQYVIDPDTDGRIIDINQVSLRRDGTDTTIYPMSRQEWLDIPDKTTQGRPNRYFADKANNLITISLWTVPENSTDTLIMDVMRKFQDVGFADDEPDIPYYMREAFAAGLGYRLGRKFAPEQIMPRLKSESDEAFKTANGAQRERGDFAIVPSSNHRRRTGGRLR